MSSSYNYTVEKVGNQICPSLPTKQDEFSASNYPILCYPHTRRMIALTRGSFKSQQGMSWITRKAISLATITLTISEYTKTDPTTGKEVIYIESVQKATGGLAGTKEVHVCDWSEVENSDPIFGQVVARDRFFWGSTAPDGTIRPDIDIQTQTGGDLVRKFLRGEILADGSDSDGFLMDGHQDVNLGDGQGLWLQGFGDNRDARWTVEQVCPIYVYF
jgi:hypothetical protein